MSALTGFRILELAEAVRGEYCGKLLADLGADVIKVERCGSGSPTRALAPVPADGNLDGGPLFAYLNTNKRSVVLDLDTTGGADAMRELIASVDAVIDDHETADTDLPLHHPEVVFCTITPYGLAAAADPAYPLNVFHASGWGYHTPTDPDPARPPLKGPGRFLPDYEAALDAALCVTSALFDRLHTGQGQSIDISQQAVLVSRADCILGRYLSGEVSPQNRRTDYDQQGPAAFFACADGFVYLYMTSARHWAGLRHLTGAPAWLDEFEDDWLEFGVTPAKVSAFRRGFAAWVAGRAKGPLSEQSQRLCVPLVVLNDADDLRRSPQYRHRGFFVEADHPVLGTAAYPTVGYRLSDTPARIERPAPRHGQHTAEVGRSLRRQRPALPAGAPAPRAVKHPRGGPLQGVRVVELTKVWAGPYAGKLLAYLGAEVIKVENAATPDEMRAYGGTDINHAPFFLSINPEILSVQLDIKCPTDVDRLRALIARSDIVIDNLRPGAMERRGLGYQELRAVKRDIVSVSIKMWGNDGPLGYQTGYAPCFAALAGLSSLVGYPGGPPLGANMRYGDSTVGAAAAFAAVAALVHRDRTGRGQFVDVSAVETLSSMIGDSLFEQNLTGATLAPDGNRHPDLCPHGCYPCADGDWISIAVSGDAEWQRLCDILGAGELAGDARYATPAGRHRHTDTLDARLGELTRGHDATALARQLCAGGVAAAKSATAVDVLSDQRLWDREVYRFVSDHREGQRPVLGAPWRMARNPARIERGAPDLGEHTGYVCDEILSGALR